MKSVRIPLHPACALLLALPLASCTNFFWPVRTDSAAGTVVPIVEEESVALPASITSADPSARLEMICVSFSGADEDSIVLGEGVEAITRRASVAPFRLAKYELSYNVWHAVRIWAEGRGYTFENKGSEGAYTDTPGDAFKNLYNEGGTPAMQGMPVFALSWRDEIVWCNAFSELCGARPVYYSDRELKHPIKDSAYREGEPPKAGSVPLPYGSACATDQNSIRKGCIDNPFVDADADGYRLPYVREWEYAARKCPDGTFISGGNAPGDRSGRASGSTEPTLDEIIQGITPQPVSQNPTDYGWSMGYNSGAQFSSRLDGPSQTAAGWDDSNGAVNAHYAAGQFRTHKQGGKEPSALGFYDLAGNVFEWCFDNGARYDWEYDVSSTRSMKSSNYSSSFQDFASCGRHSYFSYLKIGGMRLARNL